MKLHLNAPQHHIFTSPKPRTLALFGQGGGKTWEMGVLSYFFIQYCPRSLGLIAANTYGQLSDSTLREIFDVWDKQFGITEYSQRNPEGNYVIDKKPPDHFTNHGRVFKSNNNKIFFDSGQVIMLASLENYKSIEGRTIAWALLDETTDTREAAVKEVITGRLREETIAINTGARKDQFQFIDSNDPNAGKVINPLFIFTKPSKEQWLNEFFEIEQYRERIKATVFHKNKFFTADDNTRRIVIASAYFNQRNLPSGYIEDRKAELSDDLISMLIYASPFGKTGAEYYSTFNHEQHVQKVKHNNRLPLHITFDFNVNPYMTMQVWQVSNNEARCLQEYAMSTPHNTIEDTCRAFLDDWEHLCGAGVYYYGDSSGKNRQPSKMFKSYFDIIERELKHVLTRRSRRLLKQNPRHRGVGKGTLGRREFMCGVLKGGKSVTIKINPSCKYTIADLEFIKEDANGAKKKEKAEINGIVCEKYGHMSDAMDAIICYLFGEYNRE